MTELTNFEEWKKALLPAMEGLEKELNGLREKINQVQNTRSELTKSFSKFLAQSDQASIDTLYALMLKFELLEPPPDLVHDPKALYLRAKAGLIRLQKNGITKAQEFDEGHQLLLKLRVLTLETEHLVGATHRGYEKVIAIFSLGLERLRGIRQSTLEKQTAMLNKSIWRFTLIVALFTTGILATTIISLLIQLGLLK